MKLSAPRTKADFYQRWVAGEFGNRLRSFDTLDELRQSGYVGPVGLRYKEAGSPYCDIHVPPDEVCKRVREFVSQGARPELFTYNEPAPDHLLTMQGELTIGLKGLALYYSRDQAPMRVALAATGRQVDGLRAKLTLEAYCNPKSYDMLIYLLDRYDPGPNVYGTPVVEFSCFDVELGDMPGHNTLIWEVRDY